jgi:hypothetical protein
MHPGNLDHIRRSTVVGSDGVTKASLPGCWSVWPPNVELLLGDRGYNADWLTDALKDKGIRACTPGRKQRKSTVRDGACRRPVRRSRPRMSVGPHGSRKSARPSLADHSSTCDSHRLCRCPPDQLGLTKFNRVLMEPWAGKKLRAECEMRRGQKPRKRAMKSNAGIATCGIITFGNKAQKRFARQSKKKQDDAFRTLADAIAEKLKSELAEREAHVRGMREHIVRSGDPQAQKQEALAKERTPEIMSPNHSDDLPAPSRDAIDETGAMRSNEKKSSKHRSTA